MRVPLTLRVPIEEDWDAGARLQVYTNNGSGAIDTSAPLLARAKEVFPNRVRSDGWGRHRHGYQRHGDLRAGRRRNGGWGDHTWCQMPWGSAQRYAEVTVNMPAAIGLWKFGVKVTDAEGNDQSGGLIELERIVSGTEPRGIERFAFSSYNAETDTFTFEVA